MIKNFVNTMNETEKNCVQDINSCDYMQNYACRKGFCEPYTTYLKYYNPDKEYFTFEVELFSNTTSLSPNDESLSAVICLEDEKWHSNCVIFSNDDFFSLQTKYLAIISANVTFLESLTPSESQYLFYSETDLLDLNIDLEIPIRLYSSFDNTSPTLYNPVSFNTEHIVFVLCVLLFLLMFTFLIAVTFTKPRHVKQLENQAREHYKKKQKERKLRKMLDKGLDQDDRVSNETMIEIIKDQQVILNRLSDHVIDLKLESLENARHRSQPLSHHSYPSYDQLVALKDL